MYFKIDIGKLNEFYSITPRYKNHAVTYWAFPVKDETGEEKFLVIEDRFVPKDQNGNQRSFTAPKYRVYVFDTLDDAKRHCEFEVHVQYLVNSGMSTYDAMSAALARDRQRRRDVNQKEVSGNE